jgi:hypothetical protein
MVNPRQVVRFLVFVLWLSLFSAASASLAFGQDFSLSVPNGFTPTSVDPGGSATAIIDLQATGGFDSPVSLSCAVTSNQVAVSPPVCAVSPTSQTPPADGPSLTITTTSTTSSGPYSIAVTGTSGSLTHTLNLTLSVVDITEDYTLSVAPTTATPSPIVAGATATTTVTVSPIASYTGTVTLSCLSITPVVTLAPVCQFSPQTVTVTSGLPPTSTLIISTTGPTPTTRLRNRRAFYGLWLAIPGLVFLGMSAAGNRRKTALGALLLMALASSVLLMPSCNSTSNLGTNGDTPKNTYTFTLTGVDQNGAAPSSGTTPTTVTLTVN